MGGREGLRRKGMAALLALTMGLGSFLVLPAPRAVQADTCGAHAGNQCAHARACVGFWIFQSCTETWKYYADANGN